ncbi:MAG: cupin domain-containing protein [Betaproteobacteria bacterium]|nr:cupin domain-containing protein [Betaproteobacteria bacterium]
MNIQPFVVIPKNYPHPLNVIGVKVTVLASNAATQGYEITMQEGDEGSGPPPHSHNWDESFYVVKGKVECSHGDKTVMAEPGTLVHLPAGTVHSFRFSVGGGAMIEISGPGGFASKIFTNIDKEIPPGPPDIPKLIGILQQHGVTVAA